MATSTKPALSLSAKAKAAATEQAKADAATPMLRGKSSAAKSGAGRRRALVAALATYGDKQLVKAADAADSACRAYVCAILAQTGHSLRVSAADALASMEACVSDAGMEAPSMPTPDNVRNAAKRILAEREREARKAEKAKPAK